MKKSFWVGIVGVFALVGCVTKVDREAISFPDMPNMPVYHRVDGRQFYGDQAFDELETAERTCRTQISGNAALSPAVGNPAFDSCMRDQGYERVR